MEHQCFIYVWEPFVNDYHRLGWALADEWSIYSDPRGEHHTYLMHWPCACPVQWPKGRIPRHAN